MRRVHLPAEHGQGDRELAGRIATELGLAELHVFLTAGRPRRAAPARRLPGRDPLGVLDLLALLAGEVGKRLHR
jgi:hypothetical protein